MDREKPGYKERLYRKIIDFGKNIEKVEFRKEGEKKICLKR